VNLRQGAPRSWFGRIQKGNRWSGPIEGDKGRVI
jgi:hypothetical protein